MVCAKEGVVLCERRQGLRSAGRLRLSGKSECAQGAAGALALSVIFRRPQAAAVVH